jgi:predicted metal-dependent phosphoesterase TrpH
MPAGQPFTSLCRQMASPPQAGRVDLHLHTTASDGSYTPAQVVELGRRSGLAALAITDHDTLDGIGAARAAARQSLEVIAGVEVSAEFRGQELHLLGFFVNPEDVPLNQALAHLRQSRRQRFQEMVARLADLGVRLEGESGEEAKDGVTLGRRHLAEMLVRSGHADSIRQAFQRYLGERGRANVPKHCLPVAEAIRLIRSAGGVAAWAHPANDCSEGTLRTLRDQGMQAVEVDFPSCRYSRQRELRSLASRLELAVTGGSDCHGPDHAHHAIGRCGLSREELEELRSKIDRKEV